MRETLYKGFNVNYDKPWNTIVLEGDPLGKDKLELAGQRSREISSESGSNGFGGVEGRRRAFRNLWRQRRRNR